MRGYEILAIVLFILFLPLRIPMRGYEVSECHTKMIVTNMLRIPMRGYEALLLNIKRGSLACYESPCGVMRVQRGIRQH